MPTSDVEEVTVGPKGRLVVPARLRRQLGIEPGDILVMRADGDRLILERRRAILARLRDRYAAVPPGVSLVGQLIEQRRQEAEREAEA